MRARQLLRFAFIPVAPSVLILPLVAACAGHDANDASSVGSTTVTSAPASTTTNAAQIAQLETARDRALLRADTAESLLAAQRARNDKVMAAVAERSRFEDRIWAQLDRVDARIRALRVEIPTASFARRVHLEKGLDAIADERAKIDAAMHRIHAVPAAAWSAYQADVERDVNTLRRDVEQLQPAKP